MKDPNIVNEDKNNVYATNIKGDTIHVSEAESGRKGYYCKGCERELQAVISSKESRISYFRHDPTGVKHEHKCTYRDETHRHSLAKNILQILKRIKVPALYKYPPKGQDGLANFLEEAKFIEADRVVNELTFYEDDEGNVRWGKNLEIDERYLLIQPDVSFFDAKGEPILLIEIIATHKITDDKLIKLKRIGIDTVQIKVPKDSPQNIEASLKSTENIKWVYNNVEERTIYIPVPKGPSEGVLSADELQRKLFEESFNCRAAQIRSLIRSIERCLESEPYRDIEAGLRSELSRVKRNTETHRAELDGLRNASRSQVEARLGAELEELKAEQGRFSTESSNLERRYNTKKFILRTEEARLIGSGASKVEDIQLLTELLRRDIQQSENTKESNRKEFKQLTSRESADIESYRREEESLPATFRDAEDRLRKEFGDLASRESADIEIHRREEESLPATFRNAEDRLRKEFGNLASRESADIEIHRREEESLPATFRDTEDRLRKEFGDLRSEADRAVASRDSNGSKKLSRRIEEILYYGKLLRDWESIQSANRRNREAWKCFGKGSFKNWKD